MELGTNYFADVTAEVKNLLTNANGVLYQDDSLTILYKSEFQGCMGRVALSIQPESN